MSENNFAITEPVKEEAKEEVYIPLTHHRFIRQRKGLKEIKQRKRRERHALNKLLHVPRRAKKDMKKHEVTNMQKN